LTLQKEDAAPASECHANDITIVIKTNSKLRRFLADCAARARGTLPNKPYAKIPNAPKNDAFRPSPSSDLIQIDKKLVDFADCGAESSVTDF
jgi:hypothetical protein